MNPPRPKPAIRTIVHKYLQGVVFTTLHHNTAWATNAFTFQDGYNHALSDALKALGLQEGILAALWTEAACWAAHTCPGRLDGTGECKPGCHLCTSFELPCYCGVRTNTYHRNHTPTCPAAYNVCTCSEPTSPMARRNQHTEWCPRYEAPHN